MEERHEILTFPRNMKIHVFMHAIGSVSRHWHRSLELLFLIEGQAEICVDNRRFTMDIGDITLINSNSIHELSSNEGAVFIAVQIKPEIFESFTQEGIIPEFDCISALSREPGRFDGLRMCISRMLMENIRRSPGTDYRNHGLGYWLLGQLIENYRIPNSDQSMARQRYARRLSDIIGYIDAHYAENISLADLAASLGLSVPYLSGFFAKYMGVKFTQYCNEIKLMHALQELLDTDHTVEQVAVNNGFTESHSFIRVFKQKYNETPSAYRRRQSEQARSGSVPTGINYLSLEPSNYYSILLKYAGTQSLLQEVSPDPVPDELKVPAMDARIVQRRLRHTFKNVITVGRAHDLLNHDIRGMLTDLQNAIGFKFIKFHGILGDDMMICSRAKDGSLQFRFQMVDTALDFLLSIGLKPVIQLSFMPTALASDPEKTVFHVPFNTSPPRDMGGWNMLIDQFTRHLISRFGLNEVVSWPFTVWNEPDTPPDMFGFETLSDFMELYVNTFRTVKAVCPDIRFGTPGLLYMRHLGPPEWIQQFFRLVKASGCDPDFIFLHYYADILPSQKTDLRLKHLPASQLPREADDFSGFISASQELLASLDFGDKPVYLVEWNLTLSHRNLISDTCFKSCYIMKNLLENYDAFESFGYWSLTDLLEENPLPDSSHPFHGGLGIYTMSGIRKSVFYAFDFANRLGDELIARGDGYFVTRGRGGVQIITYNYVHYGDLFSSGDALGVTDMNRYTPFDMTGHLTVSIPITGLEPGSYTLRERFVNREHGSAFDIWVRCGGMPFSPADEKDYAGTCVPALRLAHADCTKGQYTYSATLEPLEIRFAELIPVRNDI